MSGNMPRDQIETYTQVIGNMHWR